VRSRRLKIRGKRCRRKMRKGGEYDKKRKYSISTSSPYLKYSENFHFTESEMLLITGV
jgi:hypothetical protein